MSFRDVPNNFSAIIDHLNQGTKELSSLFQFFKGIKSAFEALSAELSRLSENFYTRHPESSLTSSLLSLNKFFKNWAGVQLSFVSSLNTDIIEPLELFNEHFTLSNSDIAKRSENVLKPLKFAKGELRKIKRNYYTQSENLEKLNRAVISSNNQVQIATQKSSLERSVSICMENYKKCVEDVKTFTRVYEAEIPSVMDSFQQNEESRIHFIKSSSEKFVKFFQKFLEGTSQNLCDYNESIFIIDSLFDIKNFVGQLENPVVFCEEFLDYQSWKNTKNIEDVGDNEVVNSVIEYLVLNKPGKFAVFSKVKEILTTPAGKDLFIHRLESLKSVDKLEPDGFTKLAELLKSILSELGDDERSQMQFCKIITMSHVFYTEANSQKRYLSEELKGQEFWDNEKRWINAIQLAISAKLMVDKESMRSSSNKKKPGFLFNALKDFAQKIPIGKERTIEKSEKSSAFGVLSNFSYQMSSLSVNSAIAKQIIIKVSDYYMLESDRVCTLLSQIQVERGKMKLKPKKSINKSHIFCLILPYLSISDTVSLLCLNKSINSSIIYQVYSHWLRLNGQNTSEIRRKHWINQLKSHFPPTDYPALLTKISFNCDILGEISEIIDMDVNRSYQDKPEIHQSLKNILKTYAFYNPDVSYCQGMNFIAGTFLLQFRDEGLSFKCLIGLVKKFNMGSMFEVGVPKLRCMLYQLDQLLEIRLPTIQKVFKLEGVSSGYFSSPWFLTIFSSVLQSKIKVLLEIWDFFFMKGWKVLFKASLAILKILEPKLVKSSFDEIMSLITGNNLTSDNDIFNERFIGIAKQMKVTNSLLAQLEKEYKSNLVLSRSS